MQINLIIKVVGKGMQLFVYEDRVDMFKENSQKLFSATYQSINNIYFRQISSSKTGFIKIRANGTMFDFVTYKFKRESQEQRSFLNGELNAAKEEINKRAVAARGLPAGSSIVSYFQSYIIL